MHLKRRITTSASVEEDAIPKLSFLSRKRARIAVVAPRMHGRRTRWSAGNRMNSPIYSFTRSLREECCCWELTASLHVIASTRRRPAMKWGYCFKWGGSCTDPHATSAHDHCEYTCTHIRMTNDADVPLGRQLHQMRQQQRSSCRIPSQGSASINTMPIVRSRRSANATNHAQVAGKLERTPETQAVHHGSQRLAALTRPVSERMEIRVGRLVRRQQVDLNGQNVTRSLRRRL